MGVHTNKDILVVGGGFFGMYIAEYFARQGRSVLLCEKEQDLMQRASFSNQARVHNGYHYPRSILTALRSRVSFSRFVKEFPDAIVSSFEKYYMIGKSQSKVTAKQFEQFCNRIGAPCESAPHKITKLVNQNLVEHVFSTVEYAFDANKLKNTMLSRLNDANVDILLGAEVLTVLSVNSEEVEVTVHHNDCNERINVRQVFNCTYSMLNNLLVNSNLPKIPLKHEMTEMCLVEVPDELRDKGITMMCGPFFSIHPFPPYGLHTLSHVRYTPHYEWYDTAKSEYFNAHEHFSKTNKATSWKKMQSDVNRYIPIFSESKYCDSIWEVKSILPRSETDDSRPILFKSDYSLNGLHCILGGKIDNIYDAIEMIEMKGLQK